MAIDYSVVIPVYYNEGSLIPLFDSLKKQVITQNPTRLCEIIFVDDGSGDDSLNELLTLRSENQEIVKIIKLTRNFGQANALRAGLALARGTCVAMISADGQDPPTLINDMLAGFFDEGYEIVVCAREGRDESLFRIVTSAIFYTMIRRLSFPNMPIGGFDFMLIGRKTISTLLRNEEANPFFQGQLLWTGYRIKLIAYNRLERKVGRSRWTFAKKLTYLIDAVVAYSFFPIRFISAIGGVVAVLGFIYAAVILVARLVWGHPVEGWTPIMITVLVLGGLQIVMLGIIGEYIWRTLAQVRRREPYLIDTLYGDFEATDKEN